MGGRQHLFLHRPETRINGKGILAIRADVMTAIEHSEHAMHNLVMARIAGNARRVQYWLTRLDYWTEIVIQEGLK